MTSLHRQEPLCQSCSNTRGVAVRDGTQHPLQALHRPAQRGPYTLAILPHTQLPPPSCHGHRSRRRPRCPSATSTWLALPLLSPSCTHLISSDSILGSGNDHLPSCSHTDETGAAQYNWATFIHAYALGRWDPNRIPNPPQSEYMHFSDSFPGVPAVSTSLSPDVRVPFRPSADGYDSPRSVCPSPDSVPRFRTAAPTRLSLPLHRLRNSFSTPTAPNPDSSIPSPVASNPDVRTTAATLRWAGASVNISPLALPSPEHELTDPMRGVTATVPGSRPDHRPAPTVTLSPQKQRLGSFWDGTTDVEEAIDGRRHAATALLTSFSSAAPECYTGAYAGYHSMSPELCDSLTMDTSRAASAPLGETFRNNGLDSTDYLGCATASSSAAQVPFPMAGDQGTPSITSETLSVPALPRTRQTSSPLPISLPREPARATATDGISSMRVARAVKEEQMFADIGFLVPPNPPEELERKRALCK